jgi:CheY-like chemotaxis protein
MAKHLPLILIVEDDERIRKLYRILLKKHLRVAEADNGRDGVARAEQLMPDLILTDNYMPGWSGLEMVRQIREIPRLRNIHVIVSSGFLDTELQRAFAALGVRHFLAKPCHWKELTQIAESLENTSDQ